MSPSLRKESLTTLSMIFQIAKDTKNILIYKEASLATANLLVKCPISGTNIFLGKVYSLQHSNIKCKFPDRVLLTLHWSQSQQKTSGEEFLEAGFKFNFLRKSASCGKYWIKWT